MRLVLILFWTSIIFASIAWYAALLFYVGYKGGYEIVRMARDLRSRPEDQNRQIEET